MGWVGLEPTTNALKGRGFTWQSVFHCSFVALFLGFDMPGHETEKLPLKPLHRLGCVAGPIYRVGVSSFT